MGVGAMDSIEVADSEDSWAPVAGDVLEFVKDLHRILKFGIETKSQTPTSFRHKKAAHAAAAQRSSLRAASRGIYG